MHPLRACAGVCGMQIDPSVTPNHPECIRCGRCKKICPTGAISSGCLKKREKEKEEDAGTGRNSEGA